MKPSEVFGEVAEARRSPLKWLLGAGLLLIALACVGFVSEFGKRAVSMALDAGLATMKIAPDKVPDAVHSPTDPTKAQPVPPPRSKQQTSTLDADSGTSAPRPRGSVVGEAVTRVEWVARLSEEDHYASTGSRLCDAALIVAQDRSNISKGRHRDPDDVMDAIFVGETQRRALARALYGFVAEQRRTNDQWWRRITDGTPRVAVVADVGDGQLADTLRILSIEFLEEGGLALPPCPSATNSPN
jgi:hypothetical protein